MICTVLMDLLFAFPVHELYSSIPSESNCLEEHIIADSSQNLLQKRKEQEFVDVQNQGARGLRFKNPRDILHITRI